MRVFSFSVNVTYLYFLICVVSSVSSGMIHSPAIPDGEYAAR